MIVEQENKWREEFESEFTSMNFSKQIGNEKFYCYSEINQYWNVWKAARKKADEEINEMTKDRDRIHAHRAKLIEEITQLKEELKSERFFSSKFELQAMRGFPTSKEWHYLVKEHLKIQKQRRIEL